MGGAVRLSPDVHYRRHLSPGGLPRRRESERLKVLELATLGLLDEPEEDVVEGKAPAGEGVRPPRGQEWDEACRPT